MAGGRPEPRGDYAFWITVSWIGSFAGKDSLCWQARSTRAERGGSVFFLFVLLVVVLVLRVCGCACVCA